MLLPRSEVILCTTQREVISSSLHKKTRTGTTHNFSLSKHTRSEFCVVNVVFHHIIQNLCFWTWCNSTGCNKYWYVSAVKYSKDIVVMPHELLCTINVVGLSTNLSETMKLQTSIHGNSCASILSVSAFQVLVSSSLFSQCLHTRNLHLSFV
jgi:hypothetical protein